MTKYYDLGTFKFKLAETGNKFLLTVKEIGYDNRYLVLSYLFKTKEEAFEEILSYAEIDKEDFEE